MRLWLLAALLLVPVVGAGTLEHPELVDASGDAWPAQGALDIQRLWFVHVGGEAVDVFLQVEALDLASHATYHVRWGFGGPWPTDLASAGVGAELRAGVNRFYTIQAQSVSSSGWSEDEATEGHVLLGRPGWIVWRVPLNENTWQNAWGGVEVLSWPGADVGGLEADGAVERTALFHPSLPALLETFSPPQSAADYLDDAGDAGPGEDLLGAWMSFGAETVDVVVSLASLPRPEGTGVLRLRVTAVDPERGANVSYVPDRHATVTERPVVPVAPAAHEATTLSASGTLRFGPTGLEGIEGVWSSGGYGPDGSWTPHLSAVSAGSPGFARFRFPSALWNGSHDPARIRLDVEAVQEAFVDGELRWDSRDVLVHKIDLVGEGTPTVHAPVLAVVLLAAAFGLQRGYAKLSSVA